MSSVLYNGNVVNAVVDSLKNISSKIPPISSAIKNATNQIVSAKGFSKYVSSQISSNCFSSAVDECEEIVKSFTTEVRSKQVSILAYSKDTNDINAFLDTLSRDEFDRLNLTELDSYIGLDRRAGNILKGLAADTITAGAGLIEGAGEFLETGADFLVLGFTSIFSLGTWLYDLATGSNTTETMWKETKAFVSDKKVESIFNSFYADTELGRFASENAYEFEGVRGISKGLGYTGGVLATTMFTGGLSSGLGLGAAGSVTPLGLGVNAGLLGFASGTEEAWADGATIEKGLLYGVASGTWEGLQWWAGGKINQFGGTADKIAKGIFKGATSGVGTRVAMDVADSALEGFVQPALSMIYKDYGGTTFGENYVSAFNEAGGFANVGSQAIMGGIASVIGEYRDARKLLKAANAKESIENATDEAAKKVFQGEGGDGQGTIKTDDLDGYRKANGIDENDSSRIISDSEKALMERVEDAKATNNIKQEVDANKPDAPIIQDEGKVDVNNNKREAFSEPSTSIYSDERAARMSPDDPVMQEFDKHDNPLRGVPAGDPAVITRELYIDGKISQAEALDALKAKKTPQVVVDNLAKLSPEDAYRQSDYTSTPGKYGARETSMEAIAKEFADDDVCFHCHGTNNQTVVDGIFDKGLKVMDSDAAKVYINTLRGLESTTIKFGSGSDTLFLNQKEMLEHWPHKSADKIVVVGLPKDFETATSAIRTGTGGLKDSYGMFYQGTHDTGLYMRPEFIKGYYDVSTQSFVPNVNYYKNLPVDTQQKLFAQVKNEFKNNYVDQIDIIPGNNPFLPKNFLSESEIDELSNRVLRRTYENVAEPELSSAVPTNTEVDLPTNVGPDVDFYDSNLLDDMWE